MEIILTTILISGVLIWFIRNYTYNNNSNSAFKEKVRSRVKQSNSEIGFEFAKMFSVYVQKHIPTFDEYGSSRERKNISTKIYCEKSEYDIRHNNASDSIKLSRKEKLNRILQ